MTLGGLGMCWFSDFWEDVRTLPCWLLGLTWPPVSSRLLKHEWLNDWPSGVFWRWLCFFGFPPPLEWTLPGPCSESPSICLSRSLANDLSNMIPIPNLYLNCIVPQISRSITLLLQYTKVYAFAAYLAWLPYFISFGRTIDTRSRNAGFPIPTFQWTPSSSSNSLFNYSSPVFSHTHHSLGLSIVNSNPSSVSLPFTPLFTLQAILYVV